MARKTSNASSNGSPRLSLNGATNGTVKLSPKQSDPHANEQGEAMTPLCERCAALCCRYIALPIDLPETAAEFDNVRWYLMHENIHVFVEDDQWYIGIASRCKHLQSDNRCGIYETRPRICRKYTTDHCEWHGTEYQYDHLFTSAEQLRKFAEKELGKSIIAKPKKKKPKLRRGADGRKRVELPVS